MTIRRTHTPGGPIVIKTTVRIESWHDQLMFELLAEMEGDIAAFKLARMLMREALQHRYDIDPVFHEEFDALWAEECVEMDKRERRQRKRLCTEREAQERRASMKLVPSASSA
jgi:hypothetical protein